MRDGASGDSTETDADAIRGRSMMVGSRNVFAFLVAGFVAMGAIVFGVASLRRREHAAGQAADASNRDDTAPAQGPDDASADLWRSATTQVRDTIKYVVAGFAAVGAIVVGTAPLAGIGTVSGWWWAAAIAGGALAVGGVIFAVWQASDVLLPGVATLDDVNDREGGPNKRASSVPLPTVVNVVQRWVRPGATRQMLANGRR